MNSVSLLFCSALLASGLANAASPELDAPHLASNIGISAEAGGGVAGFLDSRAVNNTGTAGSWTVRMAFGTRKHLAGEAGYLGSAQALNTLGVDQNAMLVGNGLEAALRLNASTGMWQPYAIAGIGWTHYSVQNTSVNTSDFNRSGDVAQFPLGVGLAFRYSGFVADARFAFHPAADSNLTRATNLSTWDLGAKLGFEF